MAGTLTRQEMVNEVLDNISRGSTAVTRSATTLETMAIRWLNRAQVWIGRRDSLLYCVGETVTVADQKTYAFPDDVRSVYTMRIQDGLSSLKLRAVMPWDFDKLAPKPDEAATGLPDWYVPYKATNTFELFRIPDAAYTIQIRYSYWPADLTTDSQVSDYTRFDDVLVFKATQYAFSWMQEFADASVWRKRADEAYDDQMVAERDRFPDWAPHARGFSSSAPQSIGEYYNDPFVNRNP